jgi:hypothetical protein
MKTLMFISLAVIAVSPAIFAADPSAITPTAAISPTNTASPAIAPARPGPVMYHANSKAVKSTSHVRGNKGAATASKAAATAVTMTVSADMRGDVAKNVALQIQRQPTVVVTRIIMPIETRPVKPSGE